MKIEILKHEKSEVELKIDNITIAEILRVYLNNQGVDYAVWRKDHPSKPLTMLIKGTNVKKEVTDAIAEIKKDLSKINSLVKK